MEPLVCPLLNIVVDIKTSEKNDSRKMPKEASKHHQEEFSFKGGRHPET
jgi:hypothetical protein